MNRLYSLLGAAAVIAIAVVFIVQFRPASGEANVDSGPKCVAETHGSCISSSYFWAAYRLLTYRGGDMARLRAMGLRRQTAEGLVEQWLLNEDAKRLGLTVSEDDVSTEITQGRAHVSLPVEKVRQTAYALGLNEDLISPLLVKDRKTKRFDNKTYEKDIRTRAKLSPTEFREYQRSELIAARMRDLIRARVHVGENEAYEQFTREKSTVTLDYVRLDRRFYADLVVDSSDKTVSEWADKNKEELDKVWEQRKTQFMPECRMARHILVKLDANAGEEKSAAAKKKIERALARVNAGEDFGDVARRMSDDGSAIRNGDLGCVQKGKMVKPFEDALFSLGEGKVSGVIPTEYGFHIIKVEKIAKDADAEKIGRRQTALELHVMHEADRIATEGAKKILEAVRGGKSLKDALQAHLDEVVPRHAPAADKKATDKKAGGKDDKSEKKADEADADNAPLTAENHPQRPVVEATSPFNVTGDPIQGVQRGTDVVKIAFALAKPGDVPNDILPLESGFAVLQLKEKTPASKEQWDKDREFYVSAMRTAKQNDALVAYLQRLHAALASDLKLNQDIIAEPKVSKDEAPSDMPIDE